MVRRGCFVGGRNSIYHAIEGISVHSVGTAEIGWELDQNIIAECSVGVMMRSGTRNNYTHYCRLTNTYITIMALSEEREEQEDQVNENGDTVSVTVVNRYAHCPDCYSSENNGVNFRCSNSLGAQLLLGNGIGNGCPLTGGALGLKALCNSPTMS